jgi:pilus assembly protein Flp/PilA
MIIERSKKVLTVYLDKCETILVAEFVSANYLFPHLGIEEAMHMTRFIGLLMRDESGATAIEYGLIAALISTVIIAAITLVGTQLSSVFNGIATSLQSA